jgi:hypothetical protein
MWILAVLAALVAVLAPATAPPPAEHTEWDVTHRVRLDVDGDGADELLLVRESPRDDHAPEIAVHWSDGRVEVSQARGHAYDDVVRGFAVDDLPGEELLVRDMVSYRWSVWARRDGRWQRLEVAHPELLRDSVARDEHGYGVHFTGLLPVSHRSVDRFDVGYDYAFPPEPVYAVRTWRWTWRGGRLLPTPDGRRCVSESGRFTPCP